MLTRGFLLVIVAYTVAVHGFVHNRAFTGRSMVTPLKATGDDGCGPTLASNRRSFVSSLLLGGLFVIGSPKLASAEEGEESFASISARAAQLSSEVGEKTTTVIPKSDDPRTAYDFTLPVAGENIQFRDIVRQQYDDEGRARLKAILVVNMKEDDPTARKDIPEFISLASK